MLKNSSKTSLIQEINGDVWQYNKCHALTQIENLVDNIIVQIEKINGSYHKLERDGITLSAKWNICLEKWSCFQDEEEQIVSQVVDNILFDLVEEVQYFM